MDKLRECFDEMVVYKDLKHNSTFKALKLPSFLRDWVLKKFEDEEGRFDVEELSDFVAAYMPKKEEWLKIKNRIIIENERVKILTKISIDIDIRTEEISFSLPDFGLSNKETVIEPYVWDTLKNELVKGHETWGIVELGYRQPNDSAKPKILGKIMLTGFTDFCPYSIDIDFYKDVRSEFTTDEWIDILLGAIDYNPEGYAHEEQKIAMLTRLLPFVEKNLNLIELAPKGTGKSYVFGNISKYGLLTDGGKVSRAKMFYDTGKKTIGYITGHDYVAIDEVKLVQFSDTNEMRSILQGYMEKGRCDVNGFEVTSDAGIVFLGNIETDNMDEYKNMLTELPPLFRESALVDRIHGFIKGWDIPPMQPGLKVSGWALNTEYFCTILHTLRDDITYRAIVEELIEVSDDGYERHIEAVKRIATAYLKLLFPNVRSVKEINAAKFQQYCLRPAKRMRDIIQKQLAILDKEYAKPEKHMPLFSLRDITDED